MTTFAITTTILSAVVLFGFIALGIVWCGAYATNTLGKADILWLEIAMFASAYAAVFIG